MYKIDLSPMENVPYPQPPAPDTRVAETKAMLHVIRHFLSTELPIAQTAKSLDSLSLIHKDIITAVSELRNIVSSLDLSNVSNGINEASSALKNNSETLSKKFKFPKIQEIKLSEDDILSIKPVINIPKQKDIVIPPYPTKMDISNLGSVIKSLEAINKSIHELSDSVGGFDKTQQVVFPNDVLEALKKLSILSTDPNSPLAVRLSDGDEFYKGVATAVEKGGIRYMSGSSSQSFETNTGAVGRGKADGNFVVKTAGPNYKVRMDYTGGPTGKPVYIGMALPGTATSSATWQIQKLTYSGDNLTETNWAGGTEKFDQIYDNRAALSYS